MPPDGQPSHPDPMPVVIHRELLLVAAIVALYQVGQLVTRGDPFEHARDVWRVEQALGFAVEPALQAWVVRHEWLARLFAWYYMPMHLVPFLAFFAWHLTRRTPEYPYFRAAAVSTLVPGIITYSLYPLAPPRLLPEVGVVDLVATYGGITLTSPGIDTVANQTAAFPSEHVIWAVVLGWGLVRLHSVRWLPVAVAHVLLTSFGVLAMGHHFVIDVVAGLLYAGAAVALVDRALLVPHLNRRAGRDRTGEEVAEAP